MMPSPNRLAKRRYNQHCPLTAGISQEPAMDPSLQTLYRKYPDLIAISSAIEQAVERMVASYRAGGKVLICGNGGSAADAEHLVGELMKSYIAPRPVAELL